MIKKSRQKLKYLEYEKDFWGDIKSILSFIKSIMYENVDAMMGEVSLEM